MIMVWYRVTHYFLTHQSCLNFYYRSRTVRLQRNINPRIQIGNAAFCVSFVLMINGANALWSVTRRSIYLPYGVERIRVLTRRWLPGCKKIMGHPVHSFAYICNKYIYYLISVQIPHHLKYIKANRPPPFTLKLTHIHTATAPHLYFRQIRKGIISDAVVGDETRALYLSAYGW